MSYIGRFAPSPSGPLHFGSLVAAFGSYFQAKSQQGQWLVRMEDLDPPREMPGAADDILLTLEAYGLHWDQSVLYQSQRHDYYQAQIDHWLASGLAYYCQCTRKQIKQAGGFYFVQCRHQHHSAQGSAIRIQVTDPVYSFIDQRQGTITIPPLLAEEDFIIKRKDGWYAYNLAVVMDDIEQGVTEVVRGADLIEPTGRQMNLYRYLHQPEINYLHLPLALDAHGNKLSKQNHAPAVDRQNIPANIMHVMDFLNFSLPADFADASIEEMINWGIQHWSLKQLPLLALNKEI